MINSLIKGRVINKIQGFYYVSDGTQEYECRLRGVLKRKDKKVSVFSSHIHHDHFNPEILKWHEINKNIKYIFL